MTPGLRAAALLDAAGRVVAGDAALAREVPASGGDGLRVLRGERLTLAARVDGPALRGLLATDLATALAIAERGRAA
jgi:hypothetical protein